MSVVVTPVTPTRFPTTVELGTGDGSLGREVVTTPPMGNETLWSWKSSTGPVGPGVTPRRLGPLTPVAVTQGLVVS